MENEIINLGVFEFDTSKLEASYEAVTEKIFNLTAMQQKYRDQNKAIENEIKSLQTENSKLTATNQQSGQAYADNRAKIAQLTGAKLENFRATQGLNTEQVKARAELKATTSQMQLYLDAEGKQLTLQEKINGLLNAEVNSVNAARAANSEMLKIRNGLNTENAEELALIKQLNIAYDTNTEYIKTNVSAAEQQKMAIGDYKNQIIEAAQELNIFNGGFTGFIGRAQQAGGVLPLISTGLKSMIVGIKGITMASLTFLATPIGAAIGAIGLALGAVITYFKSTQEGIDAVTSVTRPLQAIFNALIGVVQNVGKYLVGAFTSPKKALSDLYEFVKQNLINRFTAFGEILEGIMTLDFKKVTNGVLQAGTGVENLTDKIGAAAESTGKFLDTAIKRGQEIDQLNKQIEKSQLVFERNQIKYNDLIDAQLIISKDTSNSLKDRVAASNEIIRINQQMGNEEAAIIENKIKLFNKEHEGRAILREDQKELIDLEKKLDDAEDRGINARLEQSRVIGAARKEAAAKAKEDAKKSLDEQLKAMDVELQTYITNEGLKEKSLENTIRVAQGIRDRELKKIEVERKNGLKTQKEYELAKLEIQSTYSEAASSATLENLDLELEALKLNNQRKLDANKYFSEELYYQELERIQRISDAERQRIQADLDHKVISQQEYNNKILALDQDLQAQRDGVLTEREEAQKAKEENDLIIRRELDQTNLDYDLASQLEAYDKGYEARKSSAVKAGTDLTLFEQQEAASRKAIEKSVNDNKIQLASQTLGNLASVFGEETKAGKAAAIAQTTIDTYQSATAAYKSLAGIPIVGPALGGAAAAAAVISGFANVKKITATKDPAPPKARFARGVVGLEGVGSSVSDSIDARLSLGESVINQTGSNLFPNTLSAINALGNGESSSNNLGVQGALLQDANGGNLSQLIADAVATGAAAGTAIGAQSGMENLTQNRNIKRNAEF